MPSRSSLETSSSLFSDDKSPETAITKLSSEYSPKINLYDAMPPVVLHCDPRFKTTSLGPLVTGGKEEIGYMNPPSLNKHVPIKVVSTEDRQAYDQAKMLLQVGGSLNVS